MRDLQAYLQRMGVEDSALREQLTRALPYGVEAAQGAEGSFTQVWA